MVQLARHALREPRVARGERERRGASLRHFQREARAGQGAALGAFPQHLRHDLVRELAARLLETLARPDDGLLRPRRAQAFEDFAQPGSRRGDQGDIAPRKRRGKLPGHRHRVGNRNFGKIASIAPARPDGGGERRIARPERNAMPSGEGNRERGAPGARAEDGDIHGRKPPAATNIRDPRLRNPRPD